MSLCLLTIDIETSGPSMSRHFMPCFGAAFVVVESCQVLDSKIFWVHQPPGTSWHKETVTDFWDTEKNRAWYQEVLQRSNADDTPEAAIVMAEFVTWVRHCIKKYPSLSFRISSDNPTFDLGWISYYLSKYTDIMSIDYILPETSRPVLRQHWCIPLDISAYSAGIMRHVTGYQGNVFSSLGIEEERQYLFQKFGFGFDHNPEHDAILTGVQSALILRTVIMNKKKKKYIPRPEPLILPQYYMPAMEVSADGKGVFMNGVWYPL